MTARRRAGLLALMALATGSSCASQSTYQVRRAAPGELVWNYRGRYTVRKDGQLYDDLAVLASQTTCVPRASADASRGAKLWSSGAAWDTSALVVLLAGVAAGLPMTIVGLSNDDHGLLFGGLGSLGGGALVGLTFSGVGNSRRSGGFALQLDAVNRYNDALWNGSVAPRPECARYAHARPVAPRDRRLAQLRAGSDGARRADEPAVAHFTLAGLSVTWAQRTGDASDGVGLRVQRYSRAPELDGCRSLELNVDGQSAQYPITYVVERRGTILQETLDAELPADVLRPIVGATSVVLGICSVRGRLSPADLDVLKTFIAALKRELEPTSGTTEGAANIQPVTSGPAPSAASEPPPASEGSQSEAREPDQLPMGESLDRQP